MKRVLSVVLILCLLSQVSLISVQAYSSAPVYVRCYMSATDRKEALELRELDGQVYLQAADLGRAAQMNVGFEPSHRRAKFFREGGAIAYLLDYTVLDGKYYVPLQEGADALGVSYTYFPDAKTLVMDYSPILPGDFAALCKEILSGGNLPGSPYFLGYIPQADAYGLATVYGVLTQSGFLPTDLLSLATGHYDQSLYATAYHDILTVEDGGKTELEKYLRERKKDADVLVQFLKKEHQSEESLEQLLNRAGVSLYESADSVWLGSSTKDLLAISSAIGSSPISIGDVLDTYHNMNLNYTANLAYVKALQYGTTDVSEAEEKNLYQATQRINAFLDEKGLTLKEGLREIVYLGGLDTANIGLEKLFQQTSSLGTNIATGLVKRISEYYTASKVSATEQARVLTDIQINARNAIPSYNILQSNYDPLALKYSTVLYLRACQVGYLNFKDEKGLKSIAQMAADGAKEKMLEVLSYPDELLLPVKNQPLDLSQIIVADSAEYLDVLPYSCHYSADTIQQDVTAYLFGAESVNYYAPDFTGDCKSDAVFFRDGNWCVLEGMQMAPAPICFSSGAGQRCQLLQSKNDGKLYVLNEETEQTDWFTLYGYGRNGPELIAEQRGDYGWIGDLSVDAPELQAYVDSLELKELSLNTPNFGQKTACADQVSDTLLMSMANFLQRSSSMDLMSTGDVNGDGAPDAALICYAPSQAVCYVGERKNSALMPRWKDSCGLLLESSQGKVLYTIMNLSDLQSLMESAEAPTVTQRPIVTPKPRPTPAITSSPRPAVTPRPTPQTTPAPVSNFADGTHQVVLYRDELQETDYGWMATAYAVEPHWNEPGIDVPSWEISGSGQLPILSSVSIYRQVPGDRLSEVPLDSFNSLFDGRNGLRVRIDVRSGYAVSIMEEWSPAENEWD